MPTVNALNSNNYNVIRVGGAVCESGLRDLCSSYPGDLNVFAALCVWKWGVAFIFELDMIFRWPLYCIRFKVVKTSTSGMQATEGHLPTALAPICSPPPWHTSCISLFFPYYLLSETNMLTYLYISIVSLDIASKGMTMPLTRIFNS